MNASHRPLDAAIGDKSYRINLRRRHDGAEGDRPSTGSERKPSIENVIVAASDKLDAIERCLDQYPDIKRSDIASVVFVPG